MQKPAQSSAIDTVPLRRMMDMFARISFCLLEGHLDKRALRKLSRCVRQMASVSREMQRVTTFNRRVLAMARLRSDPLWRARIHDELGGAHVIARWRERIRVSQFPAQIERRKKRAIILKQRKFDVSPMRLRDPKVHRIDPAEPLKPRKRAKVKTDKSGLFRLAPVPMWLSGETPLAPLAPISSPRRRATPSPSPRRAFAPIPLMPHDLIIVPEEPCDADAEIVEEAHPAAEFETLSNSEKLTPQEVIDWIWNEEGRDYFPPQIEAPPPALRPRALPPPSCVPPVCMAPVCAPRIRLI